MILKENLRKQPPLWIALGLIASLLGTALVVGCQKQGAGKGNSGGSTAKTTPQTKPADTESEVDETEVLHSAIRDIPKMILMDRRVVVLETTRQLNSWATKLPKEDDWSKSELIATLPELVVNSHWAADLPKLRFEEPHCEYLFQCQLMRNIRSWVLERPYRDGLFAPWVEEKKKSLAGQDGDRLENALKLFDWTIRNIMLEGAPKGIETLPVNVPLRKPEDFPQVPWHTLISAHGDAVSRARVFTQLAFQEGIPVGWICLPGLVPDEYKLWALGIPIGDEIYLLEPRLGIPLPGPNQVGIATLSDAKKDPTVLRRARVGDFSYPVVAADLAKAFIALDIEPFALGHAMHCLEKELVGEERMKISIHPDAWVKAFQKGDASLQVQLGSRSWYNLQEGVDLRERIKALDQLAVVYITRMGTYIDDTPVSRARLMHFQGNFTSAEESATALTEYMNLRIDDESLLKLPFDIGLQKQLMIKRNPFEDDQQFASRISIYQRLYRQAKLESSVFLSMAQFDRGNFATSSSFADRWMLKVKGTEPWHPMCWYLIGRCLEQENKVAEAIDMYKRSPSAQEAGNRIRARLLGREAPESAPTATN